MTGTAHCRLLGRTGYAIRWLVTGRVTMCLAGAVAGVATQALGEVRVPLKILRRTGVAGSA